MKGDDTGNHHQKRHHYLEKAGKQYALLSFSQIPGCQGSLNHILIGAPVKQVGQNHAGEKCTERSRISRPTDGIQLFSVRIGDD